MNKKEIIIWIILIVATVVLAYFVANFIHNSNKDNKNNLFESEEKIKIDGKDVSFKVYRVDQSFFIEIPDNFRVLSKDELNSKYNFENRPELVFVLDDNINVFVSTTDIKMTDNDLLDYLNNRVSSLTNMTVISKNIYEKHNKSFAKLTARDNNDDGYYYDLRFFTFNNNLVTVEFNLKNKEFKKWEKVINRIMDSICFDEKDLDKTKK